MVQLVPSKNPVLLGTKFVMNVHVANDGPSTATATQFELHLPLSYTYTSSTISQGSISILPNATYVGNLGLLPPGGHAHAALLLQPQTTGTLESHASVGAEQPDPNPLNNQAHVAVRVIRETSPGSRPLRRGRHHHPQNADHRIQDHRQLRLHQRWLGHLAEEHASVLPLRRRNARPTRHPRANPGIGALRPGKALKKKFNLKLPANAEGRRRHRCSRCR